MIYNLSRRHIKDGDPKNSDECAVALCMDDAGLVDASVMDADADAERPYELYATFDGFRCFAAAPGAVCDFVSLFDDDPEKCEPFSFEIAEDEWAGYFFCRKCSERIEIALSRLQRLAKLAGMADKAEVTVEEACPVCTHRGKAVFRENHNLEEM